ncbi:hypothetical protein FQN52_006362 [Onygenales sp. PD_12]|nr:hypothetical protein FQN52_006362 [Onygenales sp. PD_12]
MTTSPPSSSPPLPPASFTPPPSSPAHHHAHLNPNSTTMDHLCTHHTSRLEKQLTHIKDRRFNRVHRKLDGIVKKLAAREDVFREFGIVKRAIAGMGGGKIEEGGLGLLKGEIEGVKEEMEVIRRDVEGVKREIVGVKAVVANQGVRGLGSEIVRVAPAAGGHDDAATAVHFAFPVTVRGFWRLLGSGKGDLLVQLAMHYSIDGWKDWRRIEMDDSTSLQFHSLEDAVSEYPVRCLRALAAAWGLPFDLLERPPPRGVMGKTVQMEEMDNTMSTNCPRIAQTLAGSIHIPEESPAIEQARPREEGDTPTARSREAISVERQDGRSPLELEHNSIPSLPRKSVA